QADYDVSGLGDITWTGSSLAAMPANGALTYQQASSFSYSTVTAKITSANSSTGALTLRSTAGNVTIDAATGASRTGIVTIYAAGNIAQQANITAGAANIYLYPDYDNVGGGEFSYTSGTIITNGNLYIDKYSSMTLNGFTKTGTGSVYIGNSYKPSSVIVSGNIAATSSNIYIYSNGGITINTGVSITSGGALTLQADYDVSGLGDITWTGTGAATLPITGALTYQQASSFSYSTVAAKITGGTIGNLILRSTAGDVTIDAATGASRTGSVTITAANVAISASITPINNFLDITAAGNLTISSGTVDASNISSDLDINGNVTITGGELKAPAVIDDTSFTVAGNWEVSGTGIFTPGTGRVVFDAGAIGKTITTTSSGADDFYDIKFNNASGGWTLQDSMEVTSITITAGGLTLGSNTLTIAGTGTPFSNSGTFTSTGSTVVYTGTTTATNIASTTYNNLTLTPTGATTYSLAGAIVLTGNLTINTNATLDVVSGQNYGITLAGSWTNAGAFTAQSGTVTFNGTLDQTLSGTLSGATGKFFNLTINNTGTSPNNDVIFGANTDVAGTLTNSAGTLDIVTRTVNVTGNVILSGGIITGTTGVLTSSTLYDVRSGTISAILGGAVGLTKTTAGTVILSGVNTYSDATSINGGVLQISAVANLGNSSVTNTIAFNAGTLQSTSGTYSLGTNRAITLNGAGTIQSDAGTLTVDGTITNGANLLTVTGAGNVTISGVIGNGAGALTKSGAGTLTLSANNTYTGLTTISAGTLKLGATGDATNTPLGTTANGTSVTSGAVLDINGYTLGTAEALTLNGTGISSGGALVNSYSFGYTYSGLITLGSASSIVTNNGGIVISHTGTITGATFGLTLGGTNTASSIASIIGTTSGTLTKEGSGTWTLSGANTYSGATSINGGVLQISAAANLGDSSVTNTISFITGTLQSTSGTYSLGTNRAITLNSAGTIQSDAGTLTVDGTITNGANLLTVTGAGNTTISGVIGNGAGGLTKTGAGTLTLSGTNTYTG
ncbi:MAG: autotransporter-associated beta strand repeat-containing protein, partial [Syntrophales bacterium]